MAPETQQALPEGAEKWQSPKTGASNLPPEPEPIPLEPVDPSDPSSFFYTDNYEAEREDDEPFYFNINESSQDQEDISRPERQQSWLARTAKKQWTTITQFYQQEDPTKRSGLWAKLGGTFQAVPAAFRALDRWQLGETPIVRADRKAAPLLSPDERPEGYESLKVGTIDTLSELKFLHDGDQNALRALWDDPVYGERALVIIAPPTTGYIDEDAKLSRERPTRAQFQKAITAIGARQPSITKEQLLDYAAQDGFHDFEVTNKSEAPDWVKNTYDADYVVHAKLVSNQ